ncbi:MAG: peptidoglycan-associated lipoprotein Pal [Gammaproteobacteria bacterium]|nr:peptidoglycan-associated lipoprotein Pal [Gammaproteobacteria bacterium]MDH4313933.1 peptidoglycan-associated lipoprotein Pal [Gammaproteobacteria bacterium]MDH5212991.1 peptidoglycan-associated lipoprotein Pal [Gammaproteobacteria bacterium]MDH5501565.1 peptidoglycan-associated lipoprotein Pal [Gammaproteobacteria bacterium]
MKISNWVLAAFLALGLAACSKNTIPDPDTTSDGSMVGGNDASTGGYGSDGMGAGESFGDEMATDDEMAMVIYFDFDESELRPEYTDLLARHATHLANNPRVNARLEGHADERGSREYNIGLGERRSQTVRRMLLIQGASANQISTVSFGEERPAAFGSDEESYTLNRRVEIKYTQ